MEFECMVSPPIAGRGRSELESCWATRAWRKRRFGRGFEDSERCCELELAAAVLFVLLENKMIGHAGDVIADDTWERVFFRLVLIAVRQGVRMRHPEIK